MSSTQSTKLPQHEASENFSKISDLTVNPLQHVPLTKYDGGAIKQVDLAAQPAVDELKWDEVPVPKSHEHDVTSQASGVQDAKLKAGEKWEQAKVGANDLLETGKEKAAEISAIAGQKFEQTKDSLRTATTSSSTTTSTGPSTSDKLKSKAADVQESAIAAKDASVSKMTAVKDDMMDKAAQLQKSASDKTADLKQSANEKAAVVGAKATELKDASVVKATELKDASAAKATELKNTTSEKSVAAKDSTVSGLQSAKESTISNLQYAKDVTTEKLVAAKDLVTEKVAQTKETTMQAVQQLQAKTSEQLENVKAKVTELTHKASTPTSSSTSTTTTTTESAPSTTSNLIAQGQNIVQDLTHKASDLMHMGVDKTTAAFHTVSEKMGLAGASNTNSAAASDLKEIAELAKGGNASVVAGSSETLSTHTTVRSTTEFDTPQGVTRTDEFKEFKDGKLVDASAKTLKADKPAL